MAKETKKGEETYTISQLNLAAFLTVRGHTLKIEPKGRMFIWTVPKSDELMEDIEEFNNNADVPVRSYNDAHRDLRNELSSLRGHQDKQ
jgi:hypothetical protein